MLDSWVGGSRLEGGISGSRAASELGKSLLENMAVS